MELSTVDLGFIINPKNQSFMKSMGFQLRKLSEYHNASLILFSLDQVNLHDETTEGVVIRGKHISIEKTYLPRWVYNFFVQSKSDHINTMRQLRVLRNITIINPINQFNQEIILEMLSSQHHFNAFLLSYAPLSPVQFDRSLDHETILLIPQKSWARKGLVITKRANDFLISMGQNQLNCKRKDILQALKKMVPNKQYLLLEGHRFATWKDHLLECRVYMQKADGKWKVINKIAKSERFSNSIFLSHSLDQVLGELFPAQVSRIVQQLEEKSIEMCHFLDWYIHSLGTCVLDYVFDEQGQPYFIFFGGVDPAIFAYHYSNPATTLSLMNDAFKYLIHLKNQCDDTKGDIDDLGSVSKIQK